MNDIERLKRLAGIDGFSGMQPYTPDVTTSAQRRLTETERNIRPGTDEWFDLWFNNGSKQLNHMPGFRSRRK